MRWLCTVADIIAQQYILKKKRKKEILLSLMHNEFQKKFMKLFFVEMERLKGGCYYYDYCECFANCFQWAMKNYLKKQ